MACVFLMNMLCNIMLKEHSTRLTRTHNSITLNAVQCLNIPSWRHECGKCVKEEHSSYVSMGVLLCRAS